MTTTEQQPKPRPPVLIQMDRKAAEELRRGCVQLARALDKALNSAPGVDKPQAPA